MELKTTAFAVLMIMVFTWRNIKIADLDGKKYRPYGLGEAEYLLKSKMDSFKKMFKMLKSMKMKKDRG